MPNIYPQIKPIAIFFISINNIAQNVVSGFCNNCIAVIVNKTAIGSLLPDSNSNKGFKFPLKLIFFDRKTEKTAAASVEETIEPKRRHSLKDKFKIL